MRLSFLNPKMTENKPMLSLFDFPVKLALFLAVMQKSNLLAFVKISANKRLAF